MYTAIIGADPPALLTLSRFSRDAPGRVQQFRPPTSTNRRLSMRPSAPTTPHHRDLTAGYPIIALLQCQRKVRAHAYPLCTIGHCEPPPGHGEPPLGHCEPPLGHCERSVAISSPQESSLNSTRSPRRCAPRDDKAGTREKVRVAPGNRVWKLTAGYSGGKPESGGRKTQVSATTPAVSAAGIPRSRERRQRAVRVPGQSQLKCDCPVGPPQSMESGRWKVETPL